MFQGKLANTPELLDEVHRIRYQVYCIENAYEDPAQNPSGLERDEYDEHSVHGLLVHAATNAPVGTVRLVMNRPGARRGSLPIHRVCRHPYLRDSGVLPPSTTAEFSRFAISKQFRRRVEEMVTSHEIVCESSQCEREPVVTHMTIALIGVALRLAFAHGVTHLCAIMEPALLRLLTRFGIHFRPLGPQVAFHGWRQPCYTSLSSVLAGIELERPDVWEFVTEGGRLWPSAVGSSGARNGEVLQLA
jgi:N-acyl amino acid synthase of PEP-CTERM/exosortase system